MSDYCRKGSHLSFMVPIITLAQNAAEVLKEVDIGASSSDHGDFLVMRACKILRIGFTLTSELAGGSSVAPTVVVTKRPTPLSSSGASAIGTITVPDTTAVGKSVYKDVTPVSLAVGDSIHIAWTIGTGTPTGQGCFWAECEDSPEQPENNSDMVESA